MVERRYRFLILECIFWLSFLFLPCSLRERKGDATDDIRSRLILMGSRRSPDLLYLEEAVRSSTQDHDPFNGYTVHRLRRLDHYLRE